ncbi:uncharacterized protein METZ01_LOCUS102233 [marine metagenome]|uniref:Uncharacterized protein n=1 Tax=marine metagenome TaxID=408172 RepID=A0A381WA05_9ZZZZ
MGRLRGLRTMSAARCYTNTALLIQLGVRDRLM